VAPPPEKAPTPVMVADHECRRCSLCGRSDNLVLGSVDDDAAMNGRATQFDL
jgi:hypothetical protein